MKKRDNLAVRHVVQKLDKDNEERGQRTIATGDARRQSLTKEERVIRAEKDEFDLFGPKGY